MNKKKFQSMVSINKKRFPNITIESIAHAAESIESFRRKTMSCNTCSHLTLAARSDFEWLATGGDLKCLKHNVIFAHDCNGDKHEYVSLYLSEFICDDYSR